MGVGALPIDPLEVLAEQAAWEAFVESIEATIPFADSTTSTDAPVWAPGNTVGPAPIPGFTEGYVPFDVEFVTPWHDALGDYFTDPQTGVTVPLQYEGSSISPAFYDSATKTWSVNPAYVAWVQTQPNGSLQPDYQSIPAPDGPIFYHGAGPFATWNDVYVWAAEQNRIENAKYLDTAPATNASVARASQVAMGLAIKALSGFITQLADGVAALSRAVARRIDAVQLALFVVASNLNERLTNVEGVQNAIVKLAIPSLQTQISLEKHNRKVDVDRHDAATRLWTTDHVYIPLNTDIQANQVEANTKIQAVHDGIPDQVRELFPALIAPLAATVAGLATKVGALEAESEACVKPMCSVMGPTTDLGKFLKALKIAEWLALLAELAALRAGGLDDLLGDIEGWAKTAIGEIEQVFFTDGATLGQTVLGIAGQV